MALYCLKIDQKRSDYVAGDDQKPESEAGVEVEAEALEQVVEGSAEDSAGQVAEAAREEATREEAAREEAVQEEATREEAAREEAVREEAVREEAVREEAVREEAVREEAVREVVEEIADAEVTLESLQEELEAAKDTALRAQAEAQNARRRSEQDVEKARKFALERFSGELLSVVDNLERALDAASDTEDVKAISEGVDLTLKGLLDVFARFNIEQLNPVGEPFDPNLHQAMTMVPNPDMEPNTVMDVMQKGYTLGGRLIRPAMVVVSKARE